jgi:hypothetical protein
MLTLHPLTPQKEKHSPQIPRPKPTIPPPKHPLPIPTNSPLPHSFNSFLPRFNLFLSFNTLSISLFYTTVFAMSVKMVDFDFVLGPLPPATASTLT